MWLGNRRFFDADAVDAFIAEIIKAGVIPGRKPRIVQKAAGARKPKQAETAKAAEPVAERDAPEFTGLFA